MREFMPGMEEEEEEEEEEEVVVFTRGGGEEREGTQWKSMDGVRRTIAITVTSTSTSTSTSNSTITSTITSTRTGTCDKGRSGRVWMVPGGRIVLFFVATATATAAVLQVADLVVGEVCWGANIQVD